MKNFNSEEKHQSGGDQHPGGGKASFSGDVQRPSSITTSSNVANESSEKTDAIVDLIKKLS
ncbi:hypothetical protein [Lysinibacillus sp. NPDC096212]|uniref:hypothetical protein n=1 Tax=Lysinibacillus sp. NPDC096212 TaxID=3364135 RepID=UPI00382EAA7C